MDTQIRAVHIDDSIRQQWLDKLWACLFDTNDGGLMSPGQIRREHRDRDRVRQIEMAAILAAESEINMIHQGVKALDDQGNLVDTPPVESVSTHRIIENTAIEQDTDIGLDSPAKMLRSAVKDVSVRDLERSLNLKKIAILAESEVLKADIRPVSQKPVNAEWMLQWRESAENVFNPELQSLWAKMLVAEISQPGTYTLALMRLLRELGVADLENVLLVAKYTFQNYIYNAFDSYFDTDFHRRLFDDMEDLGLLSVNNNYQITLSSQSQQHYCNILVCREKALKVTADNTAKVLQLPAIKLSRAASQLFDLVHSDADIAYLFELAKVVKAKGFNVALGQWSIDSFGKGAFVEKMAL